MKKIDYTENTLKSNDNSTRLKENKYYKDYVDEADMRSEGIARIYNPSNPYQNTDMYPLIVRDGETETEAYYKKKYPNWD